MRLSTILFVIGVVCYVCAPLAFYLGISPIKALMPGDFMLALFVIGGVVAFVGIVLWHRLKLQQQSHQ